MREVSDKNCGENRDTRVEYNMPTFCPENFFHLGDSYQKKGHSQTDRLQMAEHNAYKAGRLVPLRTMKAYKGIGGIAPVILNLSTRWR